jgi:hypothetical protein
MSGSRQMSPGNYIWANIAFLLFALTGHGAPVPAAPKELTVGMVAGRWDYEWSNFPNGTIWLYPDSTYSAIHTPGSQTVYHGTYTVKGDTVTLTEWATDVEARRTTGPQEYRFCFDVSKYPALSGLSNGSVKVTLANPRREK